MSILNNKGNPIVFSNDANEPNYYTIFPNPYNVRADKQYIEGMYSPGYKKDWIINQVIRLQFQILSPIDESITIFKMNPSTFVWELYIILDPIDITPDGWLSSSVRSYSWTPTESGEYYGYFDSVGYPSQVFCVHNDLKWNKRIIEIDYENSKNDYGMIFKNGLNTVWTGKTYFQGVLKQVGMTNDIEGWTPDRGGFKKTQSTPVETAELTIVASHISEIRQLNTIFSFDSIHVNGILYDNPEPPEVTPIEKTDLINVVVKLVEKNTDYFTK